MCLTIFFSIFDSQYFKNSAHVLDENELEIETKSNANADTEPTPKFEKKPKKSILKKTHFQEDVNIDQIFIREINEEFIEKVCLESATEGKHFSEKIGKCFDEYWKNILNDGDSSIKFLQVDFDN